MRPKEKLESCALGAQPCQYVSVPDQGSAEVFAGVMKLYRRRAPHDARSSLGAQCATSLGLCLSKGQQLQLIIVTFHLEQEGSAHSEPYRAGQPFGLSLPVEGPFSYK